MTGSGVQLIDMPVVGDARGSLGIAQEGAAVPFTIRRLFYLFDLPEGTTRGYHAHRAQHQFLLMMHGEATIEADTGTMRTRWQLSGPRQGLYVPPMHWLELTGFSQGAVCAVLTSDVYDEADYLRDFDEFRHLAQGDL